jgi:hydroxyquinol 1,2-dioxygenase
VREVNHETITDMVLASFAQTPSPRLQQLLSGVVRHLHDFAREVELTEDEWAAGIDFLTRVGQQCSGTRQEFILLSDTLGLSMLVSSMNNRTSPGATESTVFGPFHVAGAPHFEHGDDVANGAGGAPCRVSGRVMGQGGEAIAGAVIEVWQADEEGMYDVQRADLAQSQGRGVLRSGEQGQFHFRSILASPYPIPHDGPVGEMLNATARHPWRPAHLHFMISAPGYKTLVTHVFRAGDAYLESDAVFGVRSSLIADWVADGEGGYRLDFDFVLTRAHADTVTGEPK